MFYCHIGVVFIIDTIVIVINTNRSRWTQFVPLWPKKIHVCLHLTMYLCVYVYVNELVTLFFFHISRISCVSEPQKTEPCVHPLHSYNLSFHSLTQG